MPRKHVLGTEKSESLVNQAAPVAGTLDDEHQQEAEPMRNRDDVASRWKEVQPPASAARRSFYHKSWRNKGRQAISNTVDQEDNSRMSTASNPFSLQDDLRSIETLNLPDTTPSATQKDLVQQAEPAESKDCPLQRLQGKMRLHNSSDPRPCRLFSKQAAAVDRESFATMSTSTTTPSPHASSRFSFGLLLQPSLELFKFKDIRTSLGGRGSGWSLWFKQDELPTSGKPRQCNIETK